MSILYNIIIEVMNDGAGDWAYAIYLLELLLNLGVEEQHIRIIYINCYDYGNDLNTLINDKLKKNIELLQCKVIDETNITTSKQPNFNIIKYTFTSNFNKEESVDKIDNIKTKLYNIAEKKLIPTDFNNIFNIITKLLDGFKVSGTNIKNGDYYCEISNENLTINDINIIDLYNTNVTNAGYPFDRIGKILFYKYKKINLIYLDYAYLYSNNLADSEIFKNVVNILFRTQEDQGFYNIDNLISIREGGHSNDNSFNCSIQYGYIRSKPDGNKVQFDKYCNDNNIIPMNSHVCYISPSDIFKVPKNLSKFIKILGYTKNINNNNKILMIGNWNELFSEINILNHKMSLDADICISIIKHNEITVTFNYKTLIIKKINSINLEKNGFNFSYLLENTNSYCMLSGDSSYMEGLTLNKRVIHIGMSNKYKMINELNLHIIEKIGYVKFKSIKNYETDIDNLQEINITAFNNNLKLYAELLAMPNYLEIQKQLTNKNFDDTIKEEINKITSKIYAIVTKQKYLKYKNKYLQLRSNLKYSSLF